MGRKYAAPTKTAPSRSRRTLINQDFPTTSAYGETLTPRVRNPRACGDASGSGCDDAQNATHLPFREDVTGHQAAAGRSPGFRIILLTAPSRRVRQWSWPLSSPVTVAGPRRILTGFPGFHRESPPATGRKNDTAQTIRTLQSRRDYTASYLSRVMVSRSMPSIRTRRVSPSRLGEWNSPTS